MIKSFKYKLYPNKSQREIIDKTIGLCQKLYNACLEEKITCYKRGKHISYHEQRSELKDIRKEFAEYENINAQTLEDVIRRLDKSYQNFFRRIKNGERSGFPRFQSYRRYNSITYRQKGFRLSGNRVQISKIGSIKLRLYRPIEGRVKACTIIRKNDDYYVCFSCEVQPKEMALTGQIVGIDMGINDFCITSNGEVFENPRNYRKTEEQLASLQRLVSSKTKGSKRRNKAIKNLAILHEYIANKRRDNAFKVAKQLFTKYDVIVREDLKIKNMVKNHNLAKSITDAGWGLFFNILESKAKQTLGKQVIKVDPKYTSQRCSNCGKIAIKTLNDRIHTCECGLEIDRDINAAINILHKGIA